MLLEIDGKPIASDGFIEFNGERVNMNEIVERKFTGDPIRLKYWRNGAEAEAEVTLKRLTSYLMQANLYEKRPEYVVYAGLVFQPLDRNLLSSLNLTDDHVRYFFNYYGPKELSKERPQPVILTQVLPDAINTHFDGVGGRMVDTVNDVKITRLADLVDRARKRRRSICQNPPGRGGPAAGAGPRAWPPKPAAASTPNTASANPPTSNPKPRARQRPLTRPRIHVSPTAHSPRPTFPHEIARFVPDRPARRRPPVGPARPRQ